MKKILFGLIAFFVLTLLHSPAHAWFRIGKGAQATFNDTGDTPAGISVSVGTTTPVAVYTVAAKDREVTIQNPSASYDLFIGTFSTVANTSGIPRVKVPKNNGTLTTDCKATLYGIYESGAGSGTLEVLGWKENDSRD